MDWSAILSPLDGLASSVDVSWCVSMALMPKPARHNLTPMYGANNEASNPLRRCSYAPVGVTSTRCRRIMMLF